MLKRPKRRARGLLAALGLAVLAGACSGYSPPDSRPQTLARKVEAKQQALYEAALAAVIGAGYRIALTDRDRGLISTNRQALPLTEEETDCGSDAGSDYIDDERTRTQVSVKVRVEDGGLWVLALIHGEYVTSKVAGGSALTCVSTGRIEEDLADRIVSQL